MKVTLVSKAITSTGAWEYEREIEIPVCFPGMLLWGVVDAPPDCDCPEDRIEEMGWDHRKGVLEVFLKEDDYRAPTEEESAFWTKERVQSRYKKWKLRAYKEEGQIMWDDA